MFKQSYSRSYEDRQRLSVKTFRRTTNNTEYVNYASILYHYSSLFKFWHAEFGANL
jgi:hypothetical protein